MELLNKIIQTQMVVNDDHLASALGSGNARVYATPALITFIEKTCNDAITPYLESDYITVGTKVNIEHLKATPLGATVTCQAKLIQTDNKIFLFEVQIFEDSKLISKGYHERAKVNKTKFEAKTYNKE